MVGSSETGRYRRRLAVASRIAAAVGGGYVSAAAFTACLSLTLPLPRAEATLAATVLSFAVYAGAAIWAFAAATAARAWLGLPIPTALALVPLILANVWSGT